MVILEFMSPKEGIGGMSIHIGIRSCYDEGQTLLPEACFCYRQNGLPIKVGRLFIPMDPKCIQMTAGGFQFHYPGPYAGKPIAICGDGSQTRSFCYVSDLIEAFVPVYGYGKDITGPMNLGNPGEFTILELAQKVVK